MFKRRNLTPEQNADNIGFCTTIALNVTNLREPSVVDEFYSEEYALEDGNMATRYLDPIDVLFNQERLNNMGATAAKAFLDALQPKSDALAELRQKCSDEDLMSMVKSRHLQSPAEISAWCRYMQINIDKFNSEVQKLIQEKQANEQTEIESVEPQPNIV